MHNPLLADAQNPGVLAGFERLAHGVSPSDRIMSAAQALIMSP